MWIPAWDSIGHETMHYSDSDDETIDVQPVSDQRIQQTT